MTLAFHLSTLESSGLIRPAQLEPEIEYLFHHGLIQDAAYESMLKADRRKLHGLVGAVLERQFANHSEDMASTLALHFEKAEIHDKAVSYLRLAGDVAAARYANQEAIENYSRALELSRKITISSEQLHHLYKYRGRAMELTGQFEQALKNYDE